MGTKFAAKHTPVTPQQLVNALAAIWPSELGGTMPLEGACMLASQWALETAAGASMICNNIGNVKCPDTNAGDWCEFSTFEYVNGQRIDIHPPDPGCRFRAFATIEDGARFYLHQMWSRWTKAWPSVCKGDVDGFALGLKQDGYFTADETVYANGVRRYYATYLKTLTVPADPLSKTDPAGLTPESP